jgi:hypothetical protein
MANFGIKGIKVLKSVEPAAPQQVVPVPEPVVQTVHAPVEESVNSSDQDEAESSEEEEEEEEEETKSEKPKRARGKGGKFLPKKSK